ncbi:MAG: histone H1 [Phycisphaeraceae bacterium]|nr:histone H1 [Phycisphaeraceae bacterium]
MPKRSSKPPRDMNQLAKYLVDKSTGQLPDEPEPELTDIQKAASAMGKIGGPKGGRARAAKLTAKQRSEIAKKAAQARWSDK